MEKIQIVSILEKLTKTGGKFWAVNFDNLTTGKNNCNATIGLWDKDKARIIEDDVGLRGVCNVELVQRGEYTNITNVEVISGEEQNESEKIESQQAPQETRGGTSIH
jgi:hypothetical protein